MRQPAEWAPHAAIWTAWPSHPELWEDNLAPARAAVGAMVAALAAGETVHLLAANADAEADARAAFAGNDRVQIERMAFGDIWLRDTGPIFVTDGRLLAARTFRWNGWGTKYLFDEDRDLGRGIALDLGVDLDERDWVLEGGAIEVDGTGLCVTTAECLLNMNRNPGINAAEVERRLEAQLGLSRVLWLGEGLLNDHTDGHIDNLARFLAPGVLAIPEAAGADDPNAAVFADARARAEAFGLEVAPFPSPGLMTDEAGEVVPASYMNWIVGNAAVVLPVYGRANDDRAARALEAAFPGRRIVPVRSDAVLTGGGSFHCITQQLPALG